MSLPTLARLRDLGSRKWKRLSVVIGIALAAIVVLRYALGAFVAVYTNVLWYKSVGYTSDYARIFWTQVLLFVIFGGLMAAALSATLVVFHRFRPDFHPDHGKQPWRHRFMSVEPVLRRWLLVLIVGYFSVSIGRLASSRWQIWMLWRNAVPWHVEDPQFHRDISYFVDVYPLHRFVVTMLFRITATCLIALLVAAYAYGALRLWRGEGPRVSTALKAQVSFLLGFYILLKAVAYWLDRFALATSNRGPVTGPAYTDIHAVLPGKLVLIVVALGCAGVLFANVAVRRTRLVVISLSVMAGAALIFGVVWPAAVQRLREQPSASRVELPYIERNQQATLSAFGLDNDVKTIKYDSASSLKGASLSAQAGRNAQIRLLDPNRLSPTFNVKQQLQAYYGFKSTLDIDRYVIDGVSQDVALAVRELNLSGITRNSWTNAHLVYTHGYGVVAAPTDNLDKTGTPDFIDGGLPPKNKIPVTQPQIYYGQASPAYSIVGQPPGSKTNLEFDHPSANGSATAVHTTHTGGGGVPIGSMFNRLMYAIKLHSASILFSSEINRSSQLLTVRNPRARVAAIAPWLTLDGDTYPTVVDGHIVWVVDGYTTSSNYPYSQEVNLRSATSSTLSQAGSTVTQPSTRINYMRNSIKATVDAYSGKVTLYAWNQTSQPDPILEAWQNAFPDLIQPQSDIPAALLPHLRYPQDLFDVQRSLLAMYHVTGASDFYNGSDFWKVPTDPTYGASSRLNALGTRLKTSAPTMPSVYMSLSPTGYSSSQFALSTPLVTLNGRNLAAFVSVNCEPGPDYGKFTLLEMPAGESVESPAQIQNDIESANKIAKALTLQRGGNSKVVLGNLLTIPLGGQILWVEPVYTQATGSNSFPSLRHVIVIYGNGAPAFKSTLSAALDEALGTHVAANE